MLYPKHLIEFANASNAFEKITLESGEIENRYIGTVADIGNNITIEEDMNKTYNTATLELPALQKEVQGSVLDTIDFKRFDIFRIYFNYFNTRAEAEAASKDDLDLIFDGYVDETPLMENKMSGLIYSDLGLKSTAGLMYEVSSVIPFYNSNLQFILETAQDYSSTYVNGWTIDPNISLTWVFKVNGKNYLGEVFDEMRKNYAIQVYQLPNGYMNISVPSSFDNNYDQTWVMNLEENVFDVNYGNVAQKVDCIIVLGLNCIGIAFDPIAYQLKQGVTEDDLDIDITPTKSLLNPIFISRRDLTNEEDCQRVAREKLLEMAKNYVITLECKYEPDMTVGSPFVIINSQKVNSNQVWFVKHRTIKFDKEGGIIMIIKGFSNSITDFPEDIVLSPEGMFDTDILELSSKITSVTQLHTG